MSPEQFSAQIQFCHVWSKQVLEKKVASLQTFSFLWEVCLMKSAIWMWRPFVRIV